MKNILLLKSTYLLIFLLIFSVFSVNGQNLVFQFRECTNCATGDQDPNIIYQYGGATTYQENLVADDFGPRELGGYDYHYGIDYNSATGNDDRGDLVLALVGGIVNFNQGAGIKIVTINGTGNQDFQYMHLFRDGAADGQQSGSCFITHMNSPNGTVLAIIREDGTAIGNVNGFVTHPVSGLLIPVSNTITAGTTVGPTGSSGNVGVHLHLQCSGNKSALQFVQHIQPNYTIDILQQNNNPGITLTYPGSQTGTVKVRPIIDGEPLGDNRYDVLMNVERVGIKIKKNYVSDYDFIKGPNFRSEFIYGGIANGVAKYNVSTTTYGSWNVTGVNPAAYAGLTESPNPWDDFYYADFATRIHINDTYTGTNLYASCP
jgi:hypothetical protein